MTEAVQPDGFDAWHPGLQSEIPQRLVPLVTLFRPENSHVDYGQAREISGFCGLKEHELISFRAERLVLHELLVRVTADLSVPDGPNYEVLGLNLRGMVATILDRHIASDMPRVRLVLERVRDEACAYIRQQLAGLLPERKADAGKPQKAKLLGRWFGKPEPQSKPTPAQAVEFEYLTQWQAQLADEHSPLQRACLAALVKVVGGIVGHRGRLVADADLIVRLAANQVCNDHGAVKIGETLGPLVKAAIDAENYRVLPRQKKPVIMNVKGASAAGKSTIRPQQRQLAEKLGVPWEDFALISPDYWRKSLLEYDSLGEDYKYAAMLTGQELEIIDKKLDRYMALKASRGEMSHLLIDRFRFDSFVLERDRSSDSRLLTRFGDQIFMFFMITPPEQTVERAWQRGLKTGRYKAVDDLLFHNVEAFTGMPELFFSWALAEEKRVHFEFLDNDVPLGEVPRTAAFGWNNVMTILDVNLMLNIERYRKVNIDAKSPEEVFKLTDLEAGNSTGFIKRCAELISEVRFADQATSHVYACLKHGRLTWWDHGYIDNQAPQSGVKIALEALGYPGTPCAGSIEGEFATINVEAERHFTLGRWSGARAEAARHRPRN